MGKMDEVRLAPADFVALVNQTLEFAYPKVAIVGELANFRVSKNRWVYFDVKDEFANVKFFGTVYQLPGPLEDGMLLEVRGNPRLHPLYGFSVTVQSIQPVGEGSIKKAAELLQAKLEAEGLFDPARKRPLPYPPRRIGVIASRESAAYVDFLKILNARWGGVQIEVIDVQVQGEAAVGQIVSAVELFNQMADPPEVLVLTRGGGSPEDLQAFSTEQVTRAVAASRVPTMVAIGHEVDVSLAELAADRRASTPSNAAELLVPDRREVLGGLKSARGQLNQLLQASVTDKRQELTLKHRELQTMLDRMVETMRHTLALQTKLLAALSPTAALRRGYAVVMSNGNVIGSGQQLSEGQEVTIRLYDAEANATIKGVRRK